MGPPVGVSPAGSSVAVSVVVLDGLSVPGVGVGSSAPPQPASVTSSASAIVVRSRMSDTDVVLEVVEVGAVGLVGVAPLHAADRGLAGVEARLVPWLEVADLPVAVGVLVEPAADLEVPAR